MEIRILFVGFYVITFFAFLYFYSDGYVSMIYDCNEIVISQDRGAFEVQRVFANKSYRIKILGPFPNQTNFNENIPKYKGMFTVKAWEKIQKHVTKKED